MNDSIDHDPQFDQPLSMPGPLRSHALFITIFILSAALTSLAMTYIYPEKYAAETTILFKPENILKLSEVQVRALGSPMPYTPFKVISQTVSALAKSDDILRQVVLDLSLQVPPPKVVSPIWYVRLYKETKDWISGYAADAWSMLKYGRVIPADPVDEAVAEIRKGLKIVNEDSYVVSLTARARTPEAAAAVANRVAERLADLLRQDGRAAANKQREQLNTLRVAKEVEIFALESQLRDLLLTNRIASVQEAINRTTQSYAKLEQARAESTADLSQQEARLAALAAKMRLRAILAPDDESGAPLRPVSPDRITTAEYTKLSLERQMTDVTIGGLRNRLNSYDQALARFEKELATLTRLQVDYTMLSQKLQASTRDYAALRDALAESVVKAGDAQSELRVTSRALETNAPVSPIKFYHVALATVVAGMLSIGLAYVLNYFNIRLFLPRSMLRIRLSHQRDLVTRASLPTSVA